MQLWRYHAYNTLHLQANIMQLRIYHAYNTLQLQPNSGMSAIATRQWYVCKACGAYYVHVVQRQGGIKLAHLEGVFSVARQASSNPHTHLLSNQL